MLPVRCVVLFKHGVGFFQRMGNIDGDQVIELSFKADQMNDVLKSLTALDYGGGTFAALSYDSEEPLEKRLSNLNMHIPEKGAISAFLDQLKGVRISLPRGEGRIEGMVMGIEEVHRAKDRIMIKDTHLAILSDEGKLIRVPLLEVGDVQFLDESIRQDLRTLMDIFSTGLRKDQKRVLIHAKGEGKREVSLSYVVEAPVWKTSYRMILPEEEGQEALLQGWALVDNTTEDDWNGVTLRLVSGLPISFIHDLYTPRYRKRPVIGVETGGVVAPPLVEKGKLQLHQEVGKAEIEEASIDDLTGSSDLDVDLAVDEPEVARAPAPQRIASTSVQLHTRTEETGDLFTYEITQPVDIARSRSALVPILQENVETEPVALYNRDIREKNPMTALRIRNTTGLTLEGGPVTIFHGNNYAGEAMMETMRKEEVRFVPYSVELGVTVRHKAHTVKEAYSRAMKSGNHIVKIYRELFVTDYEFASNLDHPITVYLDHSFQYDILEGTPEPAEVTDDFWRFKIDLPPQKTTEFTVKEVCERYEGVRIQNIIRADIHQMVSDKLIPEEVKQDLEQIADKMLEINEIKHNLSKKGEQQEEIEKDQSRLRENLKALGDSTEESKLRQQYVTSLTKQEKILEQLRRDIEDGNQSFQKALKDRDSMIDKLELG